MSKDSTLIIAEEGVNERLDKFLANHLTELSRTNVQGLIKDGYVLLHDKVITNISYKVKSGDQFLVNFKVTEVPKAVATDIEFTVVYEDEYLAIVDKPAGVPTHIGAGHLTDTLVNGLIHKFGTNLSSVGGDWRPGIVHRLDKNTSGLLIVAKNDATHLKLSRMIETKAVKRVYWAFVWGMLNPIEGDLNFNMARSRLNRKKMSVVKYGGKHANTHYKTLAVFEKGVVSLVECELGTGRTHQIRVHLSHVGHPVIGDVEYGNIKAKNRKYLPVKVAKFILALDRQALHAVRLTFIHPVTGAEIEAKSVLPEKLQKLHKMLK